MTDTRLFTVFYEYNGGTYVRQIRAEDPVSSLKKSLPTLVSFISSAVVELEKALAGHNIVLLNECLNVWSTSGLINDQLLLIHIVETEGHNSMPPQDYSFDKSEQ